ncbi:uncharacterized protein [Triticum aestivum]|uniref:uncharacterized protein isoform X1 n=1 Tax=Triticum aestivum TaxID=4565 RepID=UPI001D00BA63|nr:uncharacterized protein LOC123130687 isoform X1 [Triticum aestivum]
MGGIPCRSPHHAPAGRLRRRTKFTGQSWGRTRRRCVTSVQGRLRLVVGRASRRRRPCIYLIRLSKATCALLLGHALLCASSSKATPFGSGPDPRACAAIPTASGSALAVIAFSDEEGVRFQTMFLGSAAVAGILLESILQLSDKRLPILHKQPGLCFENGLLMQSICCIQLLQWH